MADLPWSDLKAYRADARARNPLPDPATAVQALAERPQWLLWRYEPGETPEKKPRKVPYYASGKRRYLGKGNPQGCDKDRAALVDYATAHAAASKGDFDGLGFAFLPGDGLIGIDLDGMIDRETGEMSERCQAIIEACASYTEWSPSGTGVHIICSDEALPDADKTFKSNDVGVEVFSGRQYFTFTARVWPGHEALQPLSEPTFRRLRVTVKGARKAKEHTPSRPAGDAPKPAHVGGRERSTAETVALVEEALGHLSPDDYDQWIKVGAACKSGLGDRYGYMVWDNWSSRSPKYAGPADMDTRWASFQDTRATLGAIFAMAEEAGWVAPWTKARQRAASRGGGASSRPSPPPAESIPTPSEAPAGGGEGQGDMPPPDDIPPPDGFFDSAPPSPPPDDDWELNLVYTDKGRVDVCLANAELILAHVPEWQGVIAYDQFAERTVYRRRPPGLEYGADTGDWSDYLDDVAAIRLQRSWRANFSPNTVGKAVEVRARANPFHPVREALEALPGWDGVRRNHTWLTRYLGVADTPYVQLVARFFLIGMIKRVMEPGCKFDYCLVLEGEQGKGKSTAVRILAWHWFADTDLNLDNKDSLLALPGKWVYEISEMGSLMRAEEKKQKSFLSRQEDEYRPPYGKRMQKVPRQLVFVGTTNEEEYLKDMTGGRRFWPVLCEGELDLDGLREAILLMYAEALADYRAGERCWPTPEEQAALFSPEQARRGMDEPFEDILAQWVNDRITPFSTAEAAMGGLNLTADKLTPSVLTRLGMALRKLGCTRKEDRLAKDPSKRRLYVPPSMSRAKAGESASRTAQAGGNAQAQEADYVQF